MRVADTMLAAMETFDAFYDATAPEETDGAKRKALAALIKGKEDSGGAKGRYAVTSRLVDLIIPGERTAKPMNEAEVRERLLGILGTGTVELESAMRRKILEDRLERLVDEAADDAKLRSAKKTEEWGSHDLVYSRSVDDWDVTMGYFPEYVRHRVIYGHTGASPQINKALAFSVRYHKTEHYMVSKDGRDDRPGFLKFLRSPEVDRLAKAYGISYELPAFGSARRSTSHTAKGGYDAMVESLEKDLRNSPFSAEKLLNELSAITIFHEDAGLGVHLIADFPKGHPDIGMSLTFVFGADLFNLTKQRWDEFKKVPPIAMAALQLLKR